MKEWRESDRAERVEKEESGPVWAIKKRNPTRNSPKDNRTSRGHSLRSGVVERAANPARDVYMVEAFAH